MFICSDSFCLCLSLEYQSNLKLSYFRSAAALTNSSLKTESFSGSISSSSPTSKLTPETTEQLESSTISTQERTALLSLASSSTARVPTPTKLPQKPTSSLTSPTPSKETSKAATSTLFLSKAGLKEVKSTLSKHRCLYLLSAYHLFYIEFWYVVSEA